MSLYTPMHEVLSEGELGEAKIAYLNIGQAEASLTAVRAAVNPGRDQAIREGTYVQLFVTGCLVMSDTQMEKRSNMHAVHESTGDVLIAGLGLGMILIPMVTKPEVTSVTVIERSADVAALVLPQLQAYLAGKYGVRVAAKLKVIVADIFDWKPPTGQKWDCIYFDIWSDICGDALPEMGKLHRRYARRKTNKGAFMASWQREYLQRLERQERAQRRAWRW